MKTKNLLLAGVILVVFFLAACNGDTTPSVGENLEVTETSVSEESVGEPIYINNCGNPASVKQVSQHSQAVMIGGGASLGLKSGVVNGSVEGKYSSTKNVSKSITVEAAPNTNMKFILLWREKVSEGTVTVAGQNGQATYKVSVPIAVELYSAEELGCPISTPDSPTPKPVSVSTQVADPAIPNPTEIPAYTCDTINEQPPYGTEIKRGKRFKVSFTIVNTGTTTWPDDLELVLDSNPYGTVNVPTPLNKIPRVQPGDYVIIGPFDAKAPEELGYHVVSFKLGEDICWPYVTFVVVR